MISLRHEGPLRSRVVTEGSLRELSELHDLLASALTHAVTDGMPCDVTRTIQGTGPVRVEVRE